MDKAVKRMMHSAARFHFDDLISRQNERCYWCERLIVRISGNGMPANKLKVIGVDQKGAWLMNRDGLCLLWQRATIDHVVPISLKGSNEIENLVAACWECNQVRGLAQQVAANYYAYKKEGVTNKEDRFRIKSEMDILRGVATGKIKPDNTHKELAKAVQRSLKAMRLPE